MISLSLCRSARIVKHLPGFVCLGSEQSVRCAGRSSRAHLATAPNEQSAAVRKLLGFWPGKYRGPVNAAFESIVVDEDVRKKCKEKYIEEETWEHYLASTRRAIVTNPLTVLSETELLTMCDVINAVETEIDQVDHSGATAASMDELLKPLETFLSEKLFARAQLDLQESMTAYKMLCNITDMRLPHEWYPYAAE